MKFNFNTIALILFSITIVNAKLVMIIRHGEKFSDSSPSLSPKGQARAYCLINVFGKNGTYASPQKIYAQNPTEKKQSTRPKDTVTPLSEDLGIQLDLSFTSGQIKKLTNAISISPQKVILISWSNDNIPEIAEKLGISNPPDWDNDTFDEIWMIYDSDTTSYLSSNTKRDVYSGGGYTMEIVKQDIDECIKENVSRYSAVTSGNNESSDSFKLLNINLFTSLLSLVACMIIFLN